MTLHPSIDERSICFVSHSHRQRDWARAFANHLTEIGLRPFIDEQIKVGAAWTGTLQHKLGQIDYFILLVTPDAMASDWVSRELTCALMEHKKIFPIILQRTSLPLFVKASHAFDLSDYSSHKYKKLVTDLAMALGQPITPRALGRIETPPPPLLFLPSSVLEPIIAAVEPIFEDHLLARGLADSCGLRFDELLRVDSIVRPCSLVIRACESPVKSPLESARTLLLKWQTMKHLNQRLVNAALQAVEAELGELGSSQLASSGKRPDQDDPRLEEYRTWLHNKTKNVQLGPFERKLELHVALEDVYIRERGMFSKQVCEEDGEPTSVPEELELIRSVEVARQLGRCGVLLLGPAGSGKTTTLRQMANYILKQDFRVGSLANEYIPLFLPLREVAEIGISLPKRLAMYGQLEGLSNCNEDFFEALLTKHKCLLLLDGLDEAASRAKKREAVLEWINSAQRRYPSNFFVVTCRDHVFRGTRPWIEENFLRITVQSFSQEDAFKFISLWHDRIAQVEGSVDHPYPMEDPKRESARLADFISRRSELIRLATNPLMLQMMVLVNRVSGALPQHRAELYRECVLLLASRWDDSRGLRLFRSENELETLQVMETVARWLHSQEGRAHASLSEVSIALKNAETCNEDLPSNAQQIFNHVLERGGLIVGDRNQVGFQHHVFQEYLVASSFLANGDYTQLAKQLGNPWWMEVIALALGHRRPNVFAPFMQELVRDGKFEKQRSLVLECVRAAEGVNRSQGFLVELLLDESSSFDRRYTALLALREIGLGEHRAKIASRLNETSPIGECARSLLDLATAQEPTIGMPAKWRNPTDGLTYVLVPEGLFEMGTRGLKAPTSITVLQTNISW